MLPQLFIEPLEAEVNHWPALYALRSKWRLLFVSHSFILTAMANQFTIKHKARDDIIKDATKNGFRQYPHNDDYLVNRRGQFSSIYIWPALKKQTADPKGYLKTMIRYSDGRQQYALVHRLVAITFIGDFTSNGMEVDHINGDKANNNVGNLEWVTSLTNERRKRKRIGNYGFGQNNPAAKITDRDIADIRRRWRVGGTKQVKLARLYKTTPGYVWSIVNNKVRLNGTS